MLGVTDDDELAISQQNIRSAPRAELPRVVLGHKIEAKVSHCWTEKIDMDFVELTEIIEMTSPEYVKSANMRKRVLLEVKTWKRTLDSVRGEIEMEWAYIIRKMETLSLRKRTFGSFCFPLLLSLAT